MKKTKTVPLGLEFDCAELFKVVIFPSEAVRDGRLLQIASAGANSFNPFLTGRLWEAVDSYL